MRTKNSTRLKQWITLTIKVTILLACGFYLFNSFDATSFSDNLSSLSISGIIIYLLINVLTYVIQAYRIKALSGSSISIASGIKCYLIGQGANFLLPSKVGEISKIVYLNKRCALSGAASVEIVFWERFFDLSIVFGLLLITMTFFQDKSIVIAFTSFCLIMWGCIIYIRLTSREQVEKLCNLIPHQRARTFLSETLHRIQEQLSRQFFMKNGLLATLQWIVNGLSFYFFLYYACDMQLSAGELIYVFIFSAMGFAVPAAPGGVGIFEAAMVYSLGSLGYDKEGALAAAIVMHIVMYAVAISGCAFVFLNSKMTLADLRSGNDQTPATINAERNTPDQKV